jgi:hypothetical protein
VLKVSLYKFSNLHIILFRALILTFVIKTARHIIKAQSPLIRLFLEHVPANCHLQGCVQKLLYRTLKMLKCDDGVI